MISSAARAATSPCPRTADERLSWTRRIERALAELRDGDLETTKLDASTPKGASEDAGRRGGNSWFALVLLALVVPSQPGCLAQSHFSVASDGGGGATDARSDGRALTVTPEAGPSDSAASDGGPPLLTVSGDIDFGAVDCGGAATPGLVALQNDGPTPVGFAATLGRADGSPYTLVASGIVVPAHGALTISVIPRAIPLSSPVPGDYGDTLTITTDAPSDAPHILKLSEAAQGAILAFDTQNVPFGDVPVASSQSSTFHVTNSGSTAATVRLSAGAGSSFAAAPSTDTLVAAGATLTANATFAPTGTAAESGSLLLVATAGVLCAPLPLPLTLTGRGQNGGLSVGTAALAFGPTSCGTAAAPQTFALTNSGNTSLRWSLALSNTSPVPYTVSPATTGALPAGGSVTLTVTPGTIPSKSSVQANLYGDAITINTDAIGDLPHTITLGQTASGAILAFNPVALVFGLHPTGTTGSASVQVVNTGNAGATVSLASSGAAFSLTPAVASLVAPATPVAFTAVFAPGSSAVAQAATVTMATRSTDVLCAPLPTPLPVTGTGTTGVVAYSPAALAFGNQPTAGLTACGGQAAPQQVTFSNTGNQSYTVTPSLAAGATSPYTVAVSPATGVVAANGGAATVTVTPRGIPSTSAVPGAYGDTLTVTTSAAGDTVHTIPLTQGAYGAILSALPAAIAFSGTPAGGQSSVVVTLTNTGNAPAGVVWSSVSSPAFSFDPAFVVPPGGVTGTTSAYFAPTAQVGYTATASAGVSASTVLCSPLSATSIGLSGAGTSAPVVSVQPAQVAFGAVACGSAGGTRAVTIKNASAVSLTWSAALAAASAFGVSPASGTIAAGATSTVTVTSLAIPVAMTTTTAADAFGDTLTVTTSLAGDTPHVIAVAETASGAILSFGAATLVLPLSEEGLPVAFAVNNTGNLPATVSVVLANATGPAALSLGVVVSGSTSSGTPFVTSVTEAVASMPSTNATVSVVPEPGTILCQPLPPPLAITAS
jgi:hypothetical protein